jgi:hypothetical protein
MTMAWTRTLALGLLFGSIGLGASACVVSVDDDPDDNFGGDGGTAGVSGSGGAGNGGRSGSGGSTSAGTGGSAGDATGGTGGSDTFPAPTCDEEPGDDTDECARCLKQNCCTPWLGCDDENCATELVDVSECVQAIEFASTEDLGMCISMSSTADDGFVQENTQDLIDCAITAPGDAGVETSCSVECFGSDIFVE